MHGPIVLVVDDDVEGIQPVLAALRGEGYTPSHVKDGASARVFVRAHTPAYAVISLTLPDCSGLDLVRELKETVSGLTVAVMTDFASIRSAVNVMRMGATDYLQKPVDPEQLLAALNPSQKPASGVFEAAIPTLELVRWEHIHRVLSHCDGNVSEAARLLGLHRQSLQRMLRRHPPRK